MSLPVVVLFLTIVLPLAILAWQALASANPILVFLIIAALAVLAG
jgi:hypothetical protein